MIPRIIRPVKGGVGSLRPGSLSATKTWTRPLFHPRLSSQRSSQLNSQLFSHRLYSTAPPPSPSSPPPSPPRIRRSTIVFLLLGAALALPVYRQVAYFFPSFPTPGSPAEEVARAKLDARAAKLPVVAQLTSDPKWVEWDVGSRWGSDNTNTKDSDIPPRTRLTRNALGGVRGMTGYHRVFLQPETGQLVSIVHLGGALSGFPTRAHGGALATLLDEALGRCAMQTLPARTGVTARLELQYRRPVSVPDFYVVRCHPELPPDYDPANTAAPELRKVWCVAELTTVDGKTCVEARGLFVVPKGYKLGQVNSRF